MFSAGGVWYGTGDVVEDRDWRLEILSQLAG